MKAGSGAFMMLVALCACATPPETRARAAERIEPKVVASRDPHAREVGQVLRQAIDANPNWQRYRNTVHVVTDGRDVLLRGYVASREDAEFLAETAFEIDGVRKVYSELVISPDSFPR